MPTLADTILQNGTGTHTLLVFERLVAPQATSSGVESGYRLPKLTESDGDFSIVLAAGGYAMEWRLDPTGAGAVGRGPISRIEFTMPDDGGPYTVGDLIGTNPGGFDVTLAIAGWDALKALTIHFDLQVVFLSYLDSEGDGQGGRYEYDEDSDADESKPDVAIPDDVDPSDPGRWIKVPYP